jgi:hypothetical protein
MLALSIVEGFARGLVSLHTPPLLGRKSFQAKPRVSISSKLIDTKGLQVLYFGHLRKTGGRGSYRLVHTAIVNRTGAFGLRGPRITSLKAGHYKRSWSWR